MNQNKKIREGFVVKTLSKLSFTKLIRPTIMSSKMLANHENMVGSLK